MGREAGLSTMLVKHRELLLAKKSELLAEINSRMIPRLCELAPSAEDDQAAASHDQFVSLEVQRQCYRTIKGIDAALDRLTTGDYGVCLSCGEPINARRLAAIPWAAHCIRCQESQSRDIEELDRQAA